MPSQNVNTLNTLNNQYYYYGSTLKQVVAEQNQTYFAYFDGVGGTGPEIINHTAYNIKYLIDTEGNVFNPEPDIVPNRPQAIALYNLINNFEIGKNAVVKLIQSDPLLTENPNDNALVGIHPITHVGRLVTIAATGTGTASADYVTTMSFGKETVLIPPANVSNITAQFQNTYNTQPVYNLDWVDLPYATTSLTYTGFSWDNNTTSFTPNSSSTETNTRLQAKASIFVFGPPSQLPIDIDGYVVPGDGETSSGIKLRILQNNNVIGESFDYEYFSTTQYGYVEITTDFFDYNATDVFKVQYAVSNPNSPLSLHGSAFGANESKLLFIQQYSPGTIIGGYELITEVNAAELESGQYFGTINTTNNFSTLLLNVSLTSMWNQNLTQVLESASIAEGYSQPTIPFGQIQPGDYIRFQYNEDFVHRILRVQEIDGFVAFLITPSLNPNGGFNNQFIDINHFVIYRIINDGSSIILNVPKPIKGNSFSGIIQPEFVSQELVNNYDRIITNLTEREIIQ